MYIFLLPHPDTQPAKSYEGLISQLSDGTADNFFFRPRANFGIWEIGLGREWEHLLHA